MRVRDGYHLGIRHRPLIIVHSFPNPGTFFRSNYNVTTWDTTMPNGIIVFYDPTIPRGYGITSELFLETE